MLEGHAPRGDLVDPEFGRYVFGVLCNEEDTNSLRPNEPCHLLDFI